MKCKNCIFFKKDLDKDGKEKEIKDCEPSETNGRCYLNPPTVVVINSQIFYARPGVREIDMACNNIEKK